MKKCILACTLAGQLRKMKPALSQADAMRQSWATINAEYPNLAILTFKKLDGTTSKRVVSTNWSKYQPSKESNRAKKEGLKVFADMAKYATGAACIISAYESNIISLAA